jgi:hypothetical protein
MSFGRGSLSNPFIALGDFFIDPGVDDPLMGEIFFMKILLVPFTLKMLFAKTFLAFLIFKV